VKIEKAATLAISRRRRPRMSDSGPMASAPTITPTSPIAATSPPTPGSSRHAGSVRSTALTTPMTTRSKPSSSTTNQHSGAVQRELEATGTGVDIVGLLSVGRQFPTL
jgi:hypothetical protein